MADKQIVNQKAKVFSTKVKASKKVATTGRIIIDAKNYHRSIPAVVFTPDKAEELVGKIEISYTM